MKSTNQSMPIECSPAPMTIGLKKVIRQTQSPLFKLIVDSNRDYLCSDCTGGYVEDGREIFDEDEGVEDGKRSEQSKAKKESKKKLRDITKPSSGGASIRSLFGNAVAKKKEASVKTEDDDILADILGEINPKTESNAADDSTLIVKSAKAAERANEKSELAKVKDYMKNFSRVIPKRQEVTSKNTSDDVRNRLENRI